LSKEEPKNYISNYNLFKDYPELNNLKFAHNTICKWLTDILLKSPKPFRLAITRSLGAGKSTIIKSVSEDLKSNHSFKVAYVDVWKLDKDSSRRSALLRIAKDLKVDTKDLEDLEENLYGSITEVSKAKPQDSIVDKVSLIFWILISLGVGAFIFFLLFLIDGDKKLTINLGASLISSLIIISLKLFDRTFVNIQRTFNRAPLVGAEEFESSLQKIVDHKDLKDNKILIIFDNIDRAPFERTEEILTGISAFFDHEQCKNRNLLILVPFAVGNQQGLTTITIQKFFDAVIPIPELVPEDLTAYTKELLASSGWTKDSQELAELINFGPYHTPRELKHFINKFITKYNLAALMEEAVGSTQKETYLKQEVITGQHLAFAKVLICEDIYSDFLKELVINNVSLDESFSPDKFKVNFKDLKEDHTLKVFLEATADFPREIPRSPDPFLYFKGADEVLTIPGAHQLSEALSIRETEKAKTYIDTNKDAKDNIDNILKFTLKRYKNNDHRVKNAIATVVDAFDTNIPHKKLRKTITDNLLSAQHLIKDFTIHQIEKISVLPTGDVENNDIWVILDKLFQGYLEDEEKTKQNSNWMIDYLSAVIKQNDGIKRAKIKASSFKLDFLLSEKILEAMGEEYPGNFVHKENLLGLFELIKTNKLHKNYSGHIANHLTDLISVGVENSDLSIKDNISTFFQELWTFITQNVNTEDFNEHTFLNIAETFRGIEKNEKCDQALWNFWGQNLHASHTIFDENFNHGLRAHVVYLYIAAHEKIDLNSFPNAKAKYASFISQFTKKDFIDVETLYGDWGWATSIKELALPQFQNLLAQKDILDYLLMSSKNEMAELLVENISTFKDVDFIETIERLPKESDTKFAQIDLFEEIIESPSNFGDILKSEFIKRLENFNTLTSSEHMQSFVKNEFSFSNHQENIELLINWLDKNDHDLLEESVSTSSDYLKNNQTPWDKGYFCQFLIATSTFQNKTDTFIKDLFDVAIQRGIENCQEAETSINTSKKIVSIWTSGKAIDKEYFNIFETSLKSNTVIQPNDKENFLQTLESLRVKHNLKKSALDKVKDKLKNSLE